MKERYKKRKIIIRIGIFIKSILNESEKFTDLVTNSTVKIQIPTQ